MTNTTHYNMTIAEGTDVVNPLTQIFPNFNTIDSAMYANKQSGIGTASEVTTGTVHAIVRANPDSNVFRFTATSAWTSGDTMTLDGNAVVVHMSDGTVPATGAYIIGAEVLAIVNSNLVTLAISSNGGVTSFNTRKGEVVPENSDYTASMIDFDNSNTTLSSNDVQGAIEEVASIKSDLTSINETGSAASQAITSGTYFYLNGALVRSTSAISIGDTFIENTNYKVVSAGGLNDLSAGESFNLIKINSADTINAERCVRIGNVVYISGIITFGSAKTGSPIRSAKIPSEYAPSFNVAIYACDDTNDKVGNGQIIESGGEYMVDLYRPSSDTGVSVSKVRFFGVYVQ